MCKNQAQYKAVGLINTHEYILKGKQRKHLEPILEPKQENNKWNAQ